MLTVVRVGAASHLMRLVNADALRSSALTIAPSSRMARSWGRAGLSRLTVEAVAWNRQCIAYASHPGSGLRSRERSRRTNCEMRSLLTRRPNVTAPVKC